MSDESPVYKFLRQEQLWRLRDAKEQGQRLIDIGEELIRKIEKDGLKGYYSVNHDCLAVARRVHGACNELWRLRTLIEKLEAFDKEQQNEPNKSTISTSKPKRRKKKD